MKKIIVTRHPALLMLLQERHPELIKDANVLEHATEEDVKDAHVVGVLPHRLSHLAATITEVPMNLTIEDRQAMQKGDLSLERLREVAGKPVTYVVRTIERIDEIDNNVAMSHDASQPQAGPMSVRGNVWADILTEDNSLTRELALKEIQPFLA